MHWLEGFKPSILFTFFDLHRVLLHRLLLVLFVGRATGHVIRRRRRGCVDNGAPARTQLDRRQVRARVGRSSDLRRGRAFATRRRRRAECDLARFVLPRVVFVFIVVLVFGLLVAVEFAGETCESEIKFDNFINMTKFDLKNKILNLRSRLVYVWVCKFKSIQIMFVKLSLTVHSNWLKPK